MTSLLGSTNSLKTTKFIVTYFPDNLTELPLPRHARSLLLHFSKPSVLSIFTTASLTPLLSTFKSLFASYELTLLKPKSLIIFFNILLNILLHILFNMMSGVLYMSSSHVWSEPPHNHVVIF